MRSTQATWESRLEEARKEWEQQYGAAAQESFPVTGVAARHLNLWSSASDVFPFLSSLRLVTHTPLCQQCPDKTLQGLLSLGKLAITQPLVKGPQ